MRSDGIGLRVEHACRVAMVKIERISSTRFRATLIACGPTAGVL